MRSGSPEGIFAAIRLIKHPENKKAIARSFDRLEDCRSRRRPTSCNFCQTNSRGAIAGGMILAVISAAVVGGIWFLLEWVFPHIKNMATMFGVMSILVPAVAWVVGASLISASSSGCPIHR